MIPIEGINLDIGGGRFDNVSRFYSEHGAENVVYDPFNRSAEHNARALREIISNGGADSVTISNVLNVIMEPEIRQDVLRKAKRYVKYRGHVYITVYEGNKTGVGTETRDGYQLNRKTADYLWEVRQVFPNAIRKGKLIIAQ